MPWDLSGDIPRYIPGDENDPEVDDRVIDWMISTTGPEYGDERKSVYETDVKLGDVMKLIHARILMHLKLGTSNRLVDELESLVKEIEFELT